MKAVLAAALMLLPVPALAQTQFQTWNDPAAVAERHRLEMDNLRLQADQRQMQADLNQLRAQQSAQRLETDRLITDLRDPARLYPSDRQVAPPTLAGATARREEGERRLSGMDAWYDRARPPEE